MAGEPLAKGKARAEAGEGIVRADEVHVTENQEEDGVDGAPLCREAGIERWGTGGRAKSRGPGVEASWVMYW